LKPIRFSAHAQLQMILRGASEEEVMKAINTGKWEPAKMGKFQTEYRFDFNRIALTNQMFYKHKTVKPIFADEQDEIVVITVKEYYSNEEEKQ